MTDVTAGTLAGSVRCSEFNYYTRSPDRAFLPMNIRILRMNQSSVQRSIGVLLLLFAGLGGSVPVLSQSRSLPDAPGTWKPWKPLATTTGGGGKEQAATPAVVKAFEGELLTFNAILRRAPLIQPMRSMYWSRV